MMEMMHILQHINLVYDHRVFQYEENKCINLSPAFFQTITRSFRYELFIEIAKIFIMSIKKQRNKIYAHYDKNIIVDNNQFLKEFSVNLLDFKTVLLMFSNICNDFMKILLDKTVYPFSINATDLNYLFYYAKIGIKNNKYDLIFLWRLCFINK